MRRWLVRWLRIWLAGCLGGCLVLVAGQLRLVARWPGWLFEASKALCFTGVPEKSDDFAGEWRHRPFKTVIHSSPIS